MSTPSAFDHTDVELKFQSWIHPCKIIESLTSSLMRTALFVVIAHATVHALVLYNTAIIHDVLLIFPRKIAINLVS